jgi:hypothetical protein
MLNIKMQDGTRLFAAFPASCEWETAVSHALQIGAKTGWRDGEPAWLHFTFAGHEFSMSDQYSDYSLFAPSECDETTLLRVCSHFEQLLGPSKTE